MGENGAIEAFRGAVSSSPMGSDPVWRCLGPEMSPSRLTYLLPDNASVAHVGV